MTNVTCHGTLTPTELQVVEQVQAVQLGSSIPLRTLLFQKTVILALLFIPPLAL